MPPFYLILFLLFVNSASTLGQAELAPWGNLLGYRIDGQLVPFGTSVRVVQENWTQVQSTGKERQRPHYQRKNNQQIVTTSVDPFHFKITSTDKAGGAASLEIKGSSVQNIHVDGIYLCIEIPAMDFRGGFLQLDKGNRFPLSRDLSQYRSKQIKHLQFSTKDRKLTFQFRTPLVPLFRHDAGNTNNLLQVYLPIASGDITKADSFSIIMDLEARALIDHGPVQVHIDPLKEGAVFDGFGGNFRLQNSSTDPQVIDYCLDNLRVAWGRVEMPWQFWQPVMVSNPIDSAHSGNLHPNVRKAMEMAKRLADTKIPVILSAWSAPDWAIIGRAKSKPGPDGVWGNPLNPDNLEAIYQSIGDYIQYLKDAYGVEVSMFSFNESDLGINIRQTAAEHASLIRGLGAHFQRRGLRTALLLGDNSDATTYTFIDAAIADTSTYRYIGAVSFHSWRGWDKSTLKKWADAAATIHKPLLVGEGSIDAQAWGYPAIFEEPMYAREEINLYIRLLNICQPASILQWQLTADYSPLAGGGIFGNSETLHPTQRFWNLKQLSSTPTNVHALPASANRKEVTVAALGNAHEKKFVVHLVNNGPERKATIFDIPAGINSLHVYVTDHRRHMQQLHDIPVQNRCANIALEPGVFMTLMK